MTMPADKTLADPAAALDGFARRFKRTDTASGKPLAEIDKHPGCAPTDVSRYLGMATTTISSATNRQARRGLLARHRPEDNRRAAALRLTDAGGIYVAATKQAGIAKLLQPACEKTGLPLSGGHFVGPGPTDDPFTRVRDDDHA